MAISKVVYNGKTLIDLTSDTVSANTLLKGYVAHDKTGAIITGTYEDPHVLENDEIHIYDFLQDSSGNYIFDNSGSKITSKKVYRFV